MFLKTEKKFLSDCTERLCVFLSSEDGNNILFSVFSTGSRKHHRQGESRFYSFSFYNAKTKLHLLFRSLNVKDRSLNVWTLKWFQEWSVTSKLFIWTWWKWTSSGWKVVVDTILFKRSEIKTRTAAAEIWIKLLPPEQFVRAWWCHHVTRGAKCGDGVRSDGSRARWSLSEVSDQYDL